ncbi:hypothetical protein A2276_02745 [candidate division WOR-1 bacterium RIFOXYA12_FULL_43_27]|uniref:Uncharacterized protein n=1 Tax=candidate division WOR-1 bacterium RIFOXYC2_FULL_46_14 TaxID=1802587 RepID=A0A1F4U7R5_UNCSA|nr:MAG: hypothetical protein A2276_02745 [candidate division WOR-1 bacterium RIFOXYA12_FULL_43_27]OGC19372.1 MAG: hypothetical protein A2292_01585 [candidate division WOR-1 bacterium RIFOXYB2_FULL_46_45]OGC30361.1 MAG: hypothetical protein A2232_01585 [candidate division WOR-1 bacterium RIFOXYA2_FULL_46_56]OGC40961.1 MAG: hypothetical protein A2438_01585 [candidate division WOR-1 bacterium RIFOXYC2_FULL_46_14]
MRDSAFFFSSIFFLSATKKKMDRGKRSKCFQFLSLNQLGAEPPASYSFFGQILFISRQSLIVALLVMIEENMKLPLNGAM